MTRSPEMLRRLRGLFPKGKAFIAWVLSPEFLPQAPLLPVKRHEDFFLREILRPEVLETKPVVMSQRVSFVRWFFSGETLEAKPVIQKQTTGFLKWLFGKEILQ